MPQFQQLHEDTQRLSLSKDKTAENMILYAPMCKDQPLIYQFMILNKIGLDHPLLWLAMFNHSKKVRNLEQAYNQLRKAKKLSRKNTDIMITVLNQENDFKIWLQETIRFDMKNPDRNTFDTIYYGGNIKFPKNKVQKIGELFVHMNEEDRYGNQIDRLIALYNTICSDDKRFALALYEKEKAKKPNSWISQNGENLERLLSQQNKNNIPQSFKQIKSILKSQSFGKQKNEASLIETPKRHKIHDPKQSSVKILRRVSFIRNSMNQRDGHKNDNNLGMGFDEIQNFRAYKNQGERNTSRLQFTFGKHQQQHTPCFQRFDKGSSSNRRYSTHTFADRSQICQQIQFSMKKLGGGTLLNEEQNQEFFNLNRLVELHLNCYPQQIQELGEWLNNSLPESKNIRIQLKMKEEGVELQMENFKH